MDRAAEALIGMAREVRSRTSHLLERTDPSWMLWTPAGTQNHITWHAGHILWARHVLGIELLAGKTTLPPDWARRFGQDSQPATDPGPWPTREELVALLSDQQKETELLLAAADLAPLGNLIYTPAENHDNGFLIIHALHDEAIHQGEMFLLLKMCRARYTTQSRPSAN
jgi:hypothetical protein